MTKKHFKMFAEEARELRRLAKIQQAQGHMSLAKNAFAQAQGIEGAVLRIGPRLNPLFDAGRFSRACTPD